MVTGRKEEQPFDLPLLVDHARLLDLDGRVGGGEHGLHGLVLRREGVVAPLRRLQLLTVFNSGK